MAIARTAKCSSEGRGFGRGRQKLENFNVFRQVFGGFRAKTGSLKPKTGNQNWQNWQFEFQNWQFGILAKNSLTRENKSKTGRTGKTGTFYRYIPIHTELFILFPIHTEILSHA